jgi:sensor histidine kinase YesM
MLRYVSSTENTTVTLGTEVAYAQSYLESMAARFGEGLTYDIAVPDELREIVVPKLMLQPFIENCFKYVTAGKPPWEIAICGDGCRDDWSIQILDNGPGFAAQTLDRLHARLDASSPLDDQTGLSISGMGILISFRRLRLAFGESTIFTVGNRPEGGAVIRFGVGAAHG